MKHRIFSRVLPDLWHKKEWQCLTHLQIANKNMLESSWSHRHFNFVTFTRKKILSNCLNVSVHVWYVSEYKLKNSFSSVDLSIKYTHPQSFYYCFSTISGQLYHLNRRQKLHSAHLYSHFVYFFSLFECYSEREIIKMI